MVQKLELLGPYVRLLYNHFGPGDWTFWNYSIVHLGIIIIIIICLLTYMHHIFIYIGLDIYNMNKIQNTKQWVQLIPSRAICQRLNQYQRVLVATLSYIHNPINTILTNRIHKRGGYRLIGSSQDKERGPRTKCPCSINSRKMTNSWLVRVCSIWKFLKHICSFFKHRVMYCVYYI